MLTGTIQGYLTNTVSSSPTTSEPCSSWTMLLEMSWTSSKTLFSLSASPTNIGTLSPSYSLQLTDAKTYSHHAKSFLFRKGTTVYNRRHAKILTTATSLFTSSYVLNWSRYISDTSLKYTPTFDGRIVLYPSVQEVRDYFAWRQADSKFSCP